MTEFGRGMGIEILVNFYDIEDLTGGRRLIVINHIDIARSNAFHADLAQYRSAELICTVSVQQVGDREFNVDMNDEVRRVLLRLHDKYPHVSAEHWQPRRC